MAEEQYHVLSVDDDEGARMLFRLMLERQGFKVTQTETADDAIELLEDFKPDLIMTDISLPGTDGLEFTAIIRANDDFADVPIIVLSAFHDQEKIDRAMSAGADAFHKKPLVMDGLKALLTELIQKRKTS